MTALQDHACTETYRDVERMLAKLCWGAVRRHGGEFEDWMSVAKIAYMKAYEKHDPARGEFTTCAWTYVRNALSSEVTRMARHPPEDSLGDGDGQVLDRARGFDLDRLLVDLGGDARTVIMLVLDTPDEMRELMQWGGPKSRRRAAVKLQRRLGWTWARVIESFSEIKEALR